MLSYATYTHNIKAPDLPISQRIITNKNDLFVFVRERLGHLIISQSGEKYGPYLVPITNQNKDTAQIPIINNIEKQQYSKEDLDFTAIKDFDGYSNHCPHFLAPLTAVSLGAKIIEVHITSDKSKDFIDNSVSFDYKELNELVGLIRLSQRIRK